MQQKAQTQDVSMYVKNKIKTVVKYLPQNYVNNEVIPEVYAAIQSLPLSQHELLDKI